MTAGEKKTKLVALLLLLFGAGFMIKGKEEPKIPPPPDEPCPEGFHYKWQPRLRKWTCEPNEPGGPTATECPEGYVLDADGKCVPAIVIPAEPAGPEEPPGVIQVPTEPGESDDPNDYIKPYPTGGAFYQVKQGDIAYGEDAQRSIVYRYLWSEGYLAAKEYGDATDAEANAFAATVAKNNALRVEAWTTIIGCSGVNDLAYGTWGYDPNNDPDPAYTGRAIRLVKQHPNNLQRLLDGKGLARCIKLGTQATKGNASGVRVSGECHSYELLWLPMLNRQALWESGGTELKTEDGETWSDGTSKGLPPPWVTDRQFYAYPGSTPDPTPKIWGCFSLQLELD